MRKETLYKILVRRYIEDKASEREKEVFFHLLAKGKLDKHLHDAMEASAHKALGIPEPLSGSVPQGIVSLGSVPQGIVPQGSVPQGGVPERPGSVMSEPMMAVVPMTTVPMTTAPMTTVPTTGKRAWPTRLRYVAAAIFIGLIGFGVLYLRHKQDNKPAVTPLYSSIFKNEVAPGGNHALLTLANGSTVALDNADEKNIPGMQGNARLVKLDAGDLVYRATAGKSTAVYFNTVATPAGGQYRVTLADGTQVWLNALSTLRFPTSFNGAADRTVQLTGEAYFEVARNKSSPFHVRVNGVDVAVLGTSFNVNAYSDEGPLKTTLVEGSVRLNKGSGSLLLAPGQQGSENASAAAGFTLVKNADVDQAVAWKNGYFSFDDVDIRGVMRQLARWYGIQVKYEGTPSSAQFWGKMGRDLNLTQVLTGLTKSKVHFRLEGTTLTVLP